MANQCAECGKKLGMFSSETVIDEKPYCSDCGPKLQQAKRYEFEKQMEGIIISTTSSLEGYDVVQYIGTVSAFSILKLDDLQEWFADIGASWGGKSTGYAKKFADLQTGVEAQLKSQSVSKGGNAVIGAGFNVQFIESSSGEKKVMSDKEKMMRK